jgi:hypothetical protein
MAQVQLTDYLVRGQVYTFLFSYTGSASSSDIVDSANQVQGVSGAFVSDLEGSIVAITFAYAGDSSDTVQSFGDKIGGQLPLDYADIVAATVPGVAPPQIQMETSTLGSIYGTTASAASSVGDAASKAADTLASAAKTTTSLLWAVAAVAIVVLFVYVGGPGAIKRNL